MEKKKKETNLSINLSQTNTKEDCNLGISVKNNKDTIVVDKTFPIITKGTNNYQTLNQHIKLFVEADSKIIIHLKIKNNTIAIHLLSSSIPNVPHKRM
jgi:hypothetical protein